MILDQAAIQGILPHRPPFLFLDRVHISEAGRSGRGFLLVAEQHPLLSEHPGGGRTFPWCLCLETLAQTAGVVLTSGLAPGGTPPPAGYLAQASFQGLGSVAAGSELVAEVRIVRHWGRFIMAEGQAHCGSQPVATATFTLTL